MQTVVCSLDSDDFGPLLFVIFNFHDISRDLTISLRLDDDLQLRYISLPDYSTYYIRIICVRW